MDIQQAIKLLVESRSLQREEMAAVMRQVMSGDATDAQIGGLLIALRMRGETIDEIAGAAQVMRELATPVTVDCPHLVDLVGTGGDGANLFNVSTGSSFVVAAAGAHVAKHGNRGVSSSSGSSDVLETLGMPLDLDPGQVARAIEQVGVGFMFAPMHHSAMRYAVGPRRELGLRTLFNVLGPLTNPAGVRRQVVGVYDAALCQPLGEVLGLLGAEHAMVVHAEDGLDEISLAAPTRVAEWREGKLELYSIAPGDFGIEQEDLSGLSVADSKASAQLIRAALEGSDEPAAKKAGKMLALNAGATIYVAGVTASIAQGVAMAEDLLATGQAGEKLNEFITFTRAMRGEAGEK